MTTQTQMRGKLLVAELRVMPIFTSWEKIRVQMGWWDIKCVVANVRANYNLYGATIPYLPLGPTPHLIGCVWPDMPEWYSLQMRAQQVLANKSMRLRHAVTDLTNDILNATSEPLTVQEIREIEGVR